MLEIRVNSIEIDLLGKERLLQTLQTNDIEKPESFQSSFSNTYRLPDTKTNRAAFGFSSSTSSFSDFPYTFQDVQIFKEGIELVPFALLYLDKYRQTSRGAFFECRIFAGSVSFFQAIENKTLQDLDMSIYDHDFNPSTIIASQNNTAFTGGYVYDIQQNGKIDSLNTGLYSDLTASIFIGNIIQQILIDSGLEYKIEVDPEANNYILPYTNLEDPFKEEKENYSNIRRFIGVSNFPAGSVTLARQFRSNTSFNIDFTPQIIPVFFWDIADNTWQDGSSKNTITLELDIIHSSTSGNSIEVGFLIDQNTDPVYSEVITGGTPASPSTSRITTEITLEINQTIAVQARRLSGGGNSSRIYTGTVLNIFAKGLVPADAVWEVAPRLPPIPQKDFFKEAAVRFGWVLSLEPFENRLFIRQFDRVLGNLDKAIDLSSKVDTGRDYELKYKYKNWAQENNFIFSGDDSSGNFTLRVPSKVLPFSRDVFTSIFEVTTEFTTDFNSPIITRFEKTEDSPAILELAKYELLEIENPRLLFLSGTSPESYFIYDNQFYDGSPIEITAPARATFEKCNWEYFISRYFKTVKALLDNTKLIEVYILFSEIEIQNIDFTIPVFLDVSLKNTTDIYGYFYLVRIEEYNNGKTPAKTVLALLGDDSKIN